MSSAKLKGLRQITALQPETPRRQATQKSADNEESRSPPGFAGRLRTNSVAAKETLKVVKLTKPRRSCKTSKATMVNIKSRKKSIVFVVTILFPSNLTCSLPYDILISECVTSFYSSSPLDGPSALSQHSNLATAIITEVIN